MRRLHTLLVLSKANNDLSKSAHKMLIDNAVRTPLGIEKGIRVFIYGEPRKKTTAKDKQKDLVRLNILPKSYKPFEVIEGDNATITVNKRGISNKVSVYHVMKVMNSSGTTDPTEIP